MNENTIPRRRYTQHWTPAEKSIRDAMAAVEEAGAHPLLTDAVILLGQAFERVADHTDLEAAVAASPPASPLPAWHSSLTEPQRAAYHERDDLRRAG